MTLLWLTVCLVGVALVVFGLLLFRRRPPE